MPKLASSLPNHNRMSWYYLVCTAILLIFLGSLGTIDPANIYLWVPLSLDLGIFLGQGLRTLYSWLRGGLLSNENPPTNNDEELSQLNQPAGRAY